MMNNQCYYLYFVLVLVLVLVLVHLGSSVPAGLPDVVEDIMLPEKLMSCM